MSSGTLSRLSGIALIAGGALFAIGNLLHPLDHSVESESKATWEAAHIIFMFGAIVIVLGLAGLYQRQADRAGKLGLIGVVALTIGLIGIVPGAFFEAFVATAVDETTQDAIENGSGGTLLATIGMLYVVGSLLFGIATLRARVFPRAAAAFIAVSALELLAVGGLESKMGGAAIIAGTVVWGISVAWLGAALIGMAHLAETSTTPNATLGNAELADLPEAA